MTRKYSGIAHTCELMTTFYTNEVENAIQKYSHFIKSKNNKYINLDINNINISINRKTGFTALKVDFVKMLGSINGRDDIEYIYHEMYDVIEELTYNQKDLILKRFDFRLDVKVEDSKDRELIFFLYQKCSRRFHRMSRIEKYNLFFKGKTKRGSLMLNIYDKQKELKERKKYISIDEANIIRYEVQIMNQHMNYNKRAKYIDKNLECYLNNGMFFYYISKYIFPIIYTGNYYNILEAKKIIQKEVKSKKMQYKIIEFLIYISRRNIDDAKRNYSSYEFRTIIKRLNDLDINPILIPKNKGVKFLENPINEFYKSHYLSNYNK